MRRSISVCGDRSPFSQDGEGTSVRSRGQSAVGLAQITETGAGPNGTGHAGVLTEPEWVRPNWKAQS